MNIMLYEILLKKIDHIKLKKKLKIRVHYKVLLLVTSY